MSIFRLSTTIFLETKVLLDGFKHGVDFKETYIKDICLKQEVAIRARIRHTKGNNKEEKP